MEAPPSFNAAQIPGIVRVGANYTVETPVRSDGLFRDYVLKTPYGEVPARGDALLKMRINELNALALLDEVGNSQTFAKALAQAGLNPLEIYRPPAHRSAQYREGYAERRRRAVRAHRFRHQ